MDFFKTFHRYDKILNEYEILLEENLVEFF